MSQCLECQHFASQEQVYDEQCLMVLSCDACNDKVLVLSVDFEMHYHGQIFYFKGTKEQISKYFPGSDPCIAFCGSNSQDPFVMAHGEAGQLRRWDCLGIKLEGSKIFIAQLILSSLGCVLHLRIQLKFPFFSIFLRFADSRPLPQEYDE